MKNVTPLQQRAQQLREEYKIADDKQQQLQDILALERKDLINRFSSSFPSLYSLLIGSDIEVEADLSSATPVILLSYKSNKVSLAFERASSNIISWTSLNKSFKATLPSNELGKKAIREDEDRLIIIIADILFTPPPLKKEKETETLYVSYPISK